MIAGCQHVHRIQMLSPSIICNSRWQIVSFAMCLFNSGVCAVPLQAPTLTMEGGRLKRSLQRASGRDFETVPEPVWRALYHWYGANLSLPRPVSEDSGPTQQLMNLSVTVRQDWVKLPSQCAVRAELLSRFSQQNSGLLQLKSCV